MVPSPPKTGRHTHESRRLGVSDSESLPELAPDLHSTHETPGNRAVAEAEARPGYKPEIFRENADSESIFSGSRRDSESVQGFERQSRDGTPDSSPEAANESNSHSFGMENVVDPDVSGRNALGTVNEAVASGNSERQGSSATNRNAEMVIEANGIAESTSAVGNGNSGSIGTGIGSESNADSSFGDPERTNTATENAGSHGQSTRSISPNEETAERNASLSLFDQLLDSVMEIPHSRGTEATSEAETRPSTTSEPDLGAASITSAGSATDSSSAIVITVNYMFMDVANDPNPGRTGSLVVTLPNNAANREPRIISQFISLATRMAYSALVNSPKSKPGISVEKFESFKRLRSDEVGSETCSICYDAYDELEDAVVTKRRKLSPEVHTPTETASSERSDESESSGSASAPIGSAESEQKPFLCDHEEEYDHSALELPCGHVFGRSCIAHWLKENANCPLCRLSVGDVEPNTSQTHAPISYIRFGGLGEDVSTNEGEANPESDTLGGDRAQDTTESESRRPGFLRRATSVIFNASGRTETPPAPLEAENHQRSAPTRPRNSGISPIINNFQNILRRSRRNRESDSSGASSLFTSGVSSRRTNSGVHTHTSDGSSSGDFFDSLRFLYGDSRRQREDQEESRDHEQQDES